ncbi:OmpA family protein [bacterium]|nr:OmpA family protein [bacterium]
MIDKEFIKRKKGDDKDENNWLTSYGDMMTLILGFFVIIVAVSKIDPMKFELVAQSMNQAMDHKAAVERVSLDKLVDQVNQVINDEQMQDVVDVSVTPRGVEVSARGRILFPSGSSNLLRTAAPMLGKLANIIKETPYNIAVEGHTDDVPISGELARYYPSNWELSAARAASVLRYFIGEGIDAKRMQAVGYADTKNIVPNDSEDNRARNRRVSVVFLVF